MNPLLSLFLIMSVNVAFHDISAVLGLEIESFGTEMKECTTQHPVWFVCVLMNDEVSRGGSCCFQCLNSLVDHVRVLSRGILRSQLGLFSTFGCEKSAGQCFFCFVMLFCQHVLLIIGKLVKKFALRCICTVGM